MSIRTDRVAGEIKQNLATLFQNDFSRLYTGLLTITQVRMSPDLRVAKVYLSFLGQTTPKEIIVKGITAEMPHIRAGLAQMMRLRYTPELHFYLDDTMEEVEKIERLFRKIKENEHGEPTADSQ